MELLYQMLGVTIVVKIMGVVKKESSFDTTMRLLLGYAIAMIVFYIRYK